MHLIKSYEMDPFIDFQMTASHYGSFRNQTHLDKSRMRENISLLMVVNAGCEHSSLSKVGGTKEMRNI